MNNQIQKASSSIILRKQMNKSPYLSQFPKQEKEKEKEKKKFKNEGIRYHQVTSVHSTKLLKKGGRKKLE